MLAFGGTVLLFSSAATADIQIDKAIYTNGILIVQGETSGPFQIVTLDGRFKRRSDKGGHFVFRIAYRPLFCEIDLTSGRDVKSVEVKNCQTYIRRLRTPKK